MTPEHLNELRNKNFITEQQFITLDALQSKRVFSLYYELRVILYLGVLLFTSGIGLLIYKNIGELGHLLSIVTLGVLTIVCFAFAFTKAARYSNKKVEVATPYYDYLVLMGCLLFISDLGYIQFQYNVFQNNLEFITLITAIFFFIAAYRFDHLGVLSLAITALASFWGLTISPQKWYSNNFFEMANLHNTAIVFGVVLSAVALVLEKKSIKAHFTFTHLNFGSLIFLTGTLSGIFINSNSYFGYLLLLYAGCWLAVYYANKRKSFLFLLYAFVFGYIGTTFFLVDFVLKDDAALFYYFILSCGGFVYFIIRYRNYFKREV
jgi:hypothetical protein